MYIHYEPSECDYHFLLLKIYSLFAASLFVSGENTGFYAVLSYLLAIRGAWGFVRVNGPTLGLTAESGRCGRLF